jgi:hypothetical protein
VVVVAVVGLLASVGSAALGGYWANRSVERQLESQRSAKIQDQRREVYVDYLRAALRDCDAWTQWFRDQEAGNDLKRDEDEIQAAEIDVINKEGQVLLIAGPDLILAVGKFTDALTNYSADEIPPRACVNNAAFLRLRDALIDGAKPDLE